MKRYVPFVPSYSGRANFEEDSEGQWVKYEDVEKLEELNREMVEAMKAECVDCYTGINDRCKNCKIRIVLDKVEGEEE